MGEATIRLRRHRWAHGIHRATPPWLEQVPLRLREKLSVPSRHWAVAPGVVTTRATLVDVDVVVASAPGLPSWSSATPAVKPVGDGSR